MPDMVPKFDNPLYFDGDELEVCGPANLSSAIKQMKVTRLILRDHLGHVVNANVKVVVTPADPMWETEIDRGTLVTGDGQGRAFATVTYTDGRQVDISWDGAFQLLDRGAISAALNKAQRALG
jgi:hypothetical protein